MEKARVIALYLPQFHPIPENDRWWGKGFTEWTNVGKAKKYFRNHYQPRVPADLGYYDLRVPETREAQADMARAHGVEAFCYWHYWFGNGKRLLERPFNEVVSSGEPNFPFCLAWANESWKGFAHGLKNRNMLIEQLYPGDQDYIDHFQAVLPAFKDRRYLTVGGRPVFMVYKPHEIPDVKHFTDLWQRLASENGLPPIYFIAQKLHRSDDPYSVQDYLDNGFERIVYVQMSEFLGNFPLLKKAWSKFTNSWLRGRPRMARYRDFIRHRSNRIGEDPRYIPTILPGWDHSPRSGKEGILLQGSTPDLFAKHVHDVIDSVQHVPAEERLVFIKSWNEWAEGNYMEPDLKWGIQYLDALQKEVDK